MTALGRFNTPNTRNTLTLFQHVGFDSRGGWSFSVPSRPHPYSAENVEDEIDEWLKVRHTIAQGSLLPAIAIVSGRTQSGPNSGRLTRSTASTSSVGSSLRQPQRRSINSRETRYASRCPPGGPASRIVAGIRRTPATVSGAGWSPIPEKRPLADGFRRRTACLAATRSARGREPALPFWQVTNMYTEDLDPDQRFAEKERARRAD